MVIFTPLCCAVPRRKDIIRSRICKNDAFDFDGGSSASSGLSGLCIISLLLLLVCVELLLYFLHVWDPILKTFYVVPVPYHSIDLLLARDLPVATVDLEN